MSDLQILLAGIVGGAALVSGIAILLSRSSYLGGQRYRDAGFHRAKTRASDDGIHGDVVIVPRGHGHD